VAVAEECNFGRAAIRLHLSQPSLSAQIKKLEDGIRATLFLRGRAGAELTPAGGVFLIAAKRLLHLSERAVENTSSVHSGIDLPLRFGYSPFVNHHLVEETVAGYRDLVPNGQIESSSECSEPLLSMVAEGILDAALVIMPIGEHKLFVQRVYTEKLLVCLRRDDPLAREESIPQELIADRLRIGLARKHHPLLYDEVMRKFAKAKILLKPTEFVSSPAEMQFLVKMGAGFGLIRETVPLDPELTRRSISGLSLQIKTAFICHPTRPVLPLLAYRMAKLYAGKAEMNGKKRPSGSVGAQLPLQIPSFG
jgi:DNA-binding transcriptional LysR family regulator